jgi:predicted DsbA family dithiol-disulfide isomerase
VDWRAFELHPGIPPEGQPVPWPPEVRRQRGGNFQRLADEAGLPTSERTHWYDSNPAHEAAKWARDIGAEEPLRRAIYRAYFVDTVNIGSADVLTQLAADVAALLDGRYRDTVQREYDEARQIGVTGVPTFVAGGYAVVGAQPLAVFHQLMDVIKVNRVSE